MSLEARAVNGSGPTKEQFTYTNATGASQSIADHEVFSIKGNISGKRIAAIIWASNQVATSGTLANGETGQIMVAGRFSFPKDTAVSFAQGVTAWWDASANKATNLTTANTMNDFALGTVVADASTAESHVTVDLNWGPEAGGLGSSSSSAT